MNKMSDVDLMKKIRKMSDNKTEYNWNNKSGKVESHPVKSKEKQYNGKLFVFQNSSKARFLSSSC